MDKAKRRLASAFDGFRANHSKMDISVDEKVLPEHCCLKKVVRHGFPDDARCLAYDPVQRLLAIGTGNGTVRVIGDIGVDYILRHESDQPVNHIQFLINEGGLITVCGNDMIHLWNFRQKCPEIVHSIQLSKDGVTCIHLPIGSKWLYVGTDKGNIYFISVGTFQMSTYVINWNKAIDLSCRLHPGAVRQLSSCPTDPSKILICFDKGIVVAWNLQTREVDRFPLDPPVKSVCWHYDGKQLLTGNVDGSVSMYNVRKTSEPVQKTTPHGTGVCRPIPIIEWKHTNENEQVIVYTGGMPTEDGLPVPALTILRAARSPTILHLDDPVISFVTLSQVPFNSCPQQPHSVAVLLKNDLMVVDLNTTGYPPIESPHPMDLHESPVTCLKFFSECPSDLIGALTLVGCKQRKKGYSERQWPVNGGVGRECATGHQELVLTGHKDGTVRFWQASGEHLQILYRLKTASHFERLETLDGADKVSHAIKSIELCLESRLLVITGASGQVTLFRFSKTETTNAIAVVNIPLLLNSTSNNTNNEDRPASTSQAKEIKRQRKVMSRDSTHSPDTSEASGDERIVPFKVRGAPVKRHAGYQPELACLIPWPSTSCADSVTTTSLNSAYGVIALGTTYGLALVDIAQCALIYAWTSAELYGSDSMPAIQLSTQMSDASSPNEEDEDEVFTSGHHLGVDSTPPRSKSPSKSKGVVSIIRRNTAELAASIRERYSSNTSNSSVPDRPEPAEGRSVSPHLLVNDDSRLPARSQSVKTSGIMRRFTKKGNNLARSLSFHSHISEEGETPKDSPSMQRMSNNISPATSTNSIERIPASESITCLQFMHSPCKRNDPKSMPCLWVGTSAGATIALNLILPTDRLISNVVVAPSGTVVKLKGQILLQSFMDQSFCLLQAATEQFKESSKESKDSSSPEQRSVNNKILTKCSLSPMYSSSVDHTDEISQVLIIVAEMEVKTIALPSFSQLFVHKCEDIPLVKAETTHVRGYPVLMCLNAAGHIQVLSLPSLRLLHGAQLLPRSVDIEDSICQRTSFSEHGLGVYMASPSEMEKYTICSELAEQTAEAMGELFVPCDMPEAPKNNSFLKGMSSIFASPRQESLDIDTILLGDKDNTSGTGGAAVRALARTIPGPSANMDRAQASGVSAGLAAQMALQNLAERGEKLNMVVDATENLRNSAQNMASRSNKLVEKYEKKKWYNF